MQNGQEKFIKKLIICLTLILTLTTVGITVVFGGGSSGDPADGDGDGGNCSNCTCAYQPGSYVYGVRISLVYWGTGQRVSGTHSIDVFESNVLKGRAAEKPATYTILNDNTYKYNRVDMIVGGKMTDTNPKLEKTGWSKIDKVMVSDLHWQEKGISFNYGDIEAEISYSQMTKDLYNVMQQEVDEYAATDYKDPKKLLVTNALFSKLGVDFTKYTKEELEEMHLIVEPIVVVAVKGVSNMESSYNLFYGTITQVGAAFPQYNCNSDDAKNWSMSASLINRFGIGIYGTKPCNTEGDPEKCILKGWDVGDPSSTYYSTRFDLIKKKNSNGMGLLWLGALNMPKRDDCATVVEYINNLYTTGAISQGEYDQFILQVKNGTFEQKDDEDKVVYKIDTPQDFEFLIKANYDKYNDGLAACADREKLSLDCNSAIDYINSHYSRGTQAYHNAVDLVEAGTFSYELPDGTTVSIDKAYSYNMLDKSVYITQGGIAQCKDISIDVCGSYEGVNINIDDCTTGKTYFKDIEEENAWLICEIAYTDGSKVYSSDNTGHDAVETAHGGIVGNAEYCEVYCYEEYETLFPTHVYDVKAGQTFTWGTSDGKFGSVKISKKCSNQNYVKGQQGYRFEEWEEDYKNNEKAMIEYFMKNGAYEEAIDSIYISSTGWYYTCDEKCTPKTSKITGEPYLSCKYTACPEWYAVARSTSQSEEHSDGYIGNVKGTIYAKSCRDTSMSSQSDANSNAISCLEEKLTKAAADEEEKYSEKKNQEAVLIDKIEQCTNNIEYVYKSTVQFTFKEPVNSVYGANSRSFEFNDDLLVEGNYNQNNVDTSKCVKKTIYKYTCSGYGSNVVCTPEAKQVWNCSVVTWNIQGNYTYKYPVEHFQWYSLKTDSTLVNENKKGSEDPAFFYSIGFGLPTALSLTDGTYELKVTVYDIGDNATFSGGNPQYERPENTHFDPVGLNVSTNGGNKKGFEYVCTYEVDNDIFGYDCQYDANGKLIYESPEYCDPTKDDGSDGSLLGIDITYRLITLLSDGDSLDKAFPSREGDGRAPGINWQLSDEALHEILDADVYNDPAMYEIMLDVNAIQTIREDNQAYFNAGKDPYASYYDENNAQKVYCAVNGDEKYCASDFISDLYNGSGLNYKLLGTCLPTGNTLERAEHILEKGCDTNYTYPTINWAR